MLARTIQELMRSINMQTPLRCASCTLLALLVWMILRPVSAQQDFSKVEIKTTHVSGGVYMLEGSGGNIGVSIGEDGIVIVDDQFAPLAPKIKEALKGITDKPLRFV